MNKGIVVYDNVAMALGYIKCFFRPSELLSCGLTVAAESHPDMQMAALTFCSGFKALLHVCLVHMISQPQDLSWRRVL